ncbi:MAG: glycosyltransferase family 4 protein [Deltaproteobacteria bacterium]|nr:glycosyltransferase family 4 protein [Deltaproteobacteria bacterium]
MRIGLIRMRHTPFGGAETFLGRFIKELLKRGHTLDVFSREWEDDRVSVHRIKTFGPSFLKPLVFALRARKEVEMAAPDVVVSFERTYCQDIYRAGDGVHREWLERRGAACSSVKRFLIRLNPLHAVLLYLEKRLFTDKRLKKIVANSNAVKRDIIRHYGLPEDKICVIYNGIESSSTGGKDAEDPGDRAGVRAGLGVGDNTTLLVFVGSGFERKGLIYAVRALGFLKDDGDIRLLVVGKGNPSRYLSEARSLGVEDKVIFTGPVKGASKFYRAGDIFILPTIYEPFSNACLEAMAAGLPVVTSRVNGASEIMTDGVDSAILDDPADPAGIARKLKPLLNGEFRKKAGTNARAVALKYPIEKNVDEFLRLIEGVMEGAEVRG